MIPRCSCGSFAVNVSRHDDSIEWDCIICEDDQDTGNLITHMGMVDADNEEES